MVEGPSEPRSDREAGSGRKADRETVMRWPCWVVDRRVVRPAWMFWIACAGVLAGCSDPDRSSSSPSKPSFPGVKLTVGALGDPAILAGLSAERGEWVASRGGEITIQEQPVPRLTTSRTWIC